MSDTWISFNGNALSLNGYGLVVSGQNPYNPLNLPAYTVRFQFDDSSYDPTQVSGWKAGSAWTRVSTSPNIWDYYAGTASEHYQGAFSGKFQDTLNTVHVLGAYLPGEIPAAYDGASLFENCTALVETATVDISGCRTANRMFSGCTNLVSVGTINAPQIYDTLYMFGDCARLTTAPVIEYTPTLLTRSVQMFKNCSSLHDLSPYRYDTSNVTDFSGMFYGCSSLTTTPILDTSNGLTFSSMYGKCSTLGTSYLYDLSKATDISEMFYECRALSSVPLFNTRLVNNFSNMLTSCESLREIQLFPTANATNMSGMCAHCYNVESGALALYTQASTQSFPPASHSGCFSSCGVSTTSGRAELAQIPSDWK